MKNKNTLLVIVLVFVLLLGGAYVLYDRLGQDVTAEQMIVHATPQPTAENTTEEVLPEEMLSASALTSMPVDLPPRKNVGMFSDASFS